MAERAEVAEERGADAVIRRQEIRNPEFDGANHVGVSAERVLTARVQLSRADTGQRKTAETVAALEETLVQDDVLTIPTLNISARLLEAGNEFVPQNREVDAERVFRSDELLVAAEACKVVVEAEHEAVPRFNRIVERVVAVAVAERRRVEGTGRLLNDRAGAHERRKARNAEGVAQADGTIFRRRKAEAHAGRRRVARVVGLLKIKNGFVDVETCRQRPVHEVGLGEAERRLLFERRQLEARLQVLAFAEKVALSVAELTDERTLRRIAGSERQFTRRLLGDVDVEDRAIGRRSLRRLDV